MKTSPLLSALAVLLCISTGTLRAETRTWTGSTDQNFNLRANYSPGGGGSLPTGDHVVFTQVANPVMTASVAIGSLQLDSPADGFTLGGAYNLVIGAGGLVLADGVNATFSNSRISSNTTATALTFSVAADANLAISTLVHTQTILFHKKGSGQLTLGENASMLAQQRGGFRFEEGIIYFSSGSTLAYENPDATRPDGKVAIQLGTTKTSATIAGSGLLNATVNTLGAEHSTLTPEGLLTIRHLNAQEGASFHYTLGSGTISGGNYTDSSLNLSGAAIRFSFSGGVAGQAYTLFEHYEAMGTDLSQFALATEGYILDTSYGNGGWLIDNDSIKVRFAAVPEPSSAVFLGLGMTLTVGLLRYSTTPARP